jgi:hypothetical protein
LGLTDLAVVSGEGPPRVSPLETAGSQARKPDVSDEPRDEESEAPSGEPWSSPEIVTFTTVEELRRRFPALAAELERRGLIRNGQVIRREP